MKKWQDFSVKFYLGIFLIIASFALGALVKVVFVVYIFDTFLRWLSIIVYIITWVMLGLGIWWAGKESYKGIQRYMDYHYYQESLRKGTQQAYSQFKERVAKKQLKKKSKKYSKTRKV
jgi:high-affinity Fe2+/Pb2+ permease